MPAKPINIEENRVNPVAIILDTDPGIDDAVAIAAALFHPGVALALITTVAGNVD
ncbi:TPA: nucleoside hydrolase, partial [Aeromonas sobria]|nr:nucleoside hydrolase [Aeromonas sobria]HEH9432609.1 nucleoside hydrolase [Aeromonas sobria]